MSRTLLNVLIVAAIAAVVAVVPGGGTGAHVIGAAVSLAFLGALAWAAMVLYREHRMSLYSIGDRRRAMVYVAVGVVALTLTGTSRLWHTAAGELIWFALLIGAVYAVATVALAARRY